MAALSGLSLELVTRFEGRVPYDVFVRELLRSDRKALGLYDASVSAVDPFPDRLKYEGPEPTLSAIDRVFTSGINAVLREWIGIDCERDYRLLTFDIYNFWKNDARKHETFESHIGATDDLRYGMALNSHMKVFLTHGYFDLITPYFASTRLFSQMKLTDEQKKKVTIKHFHGGHMFYTWKKSREDFVKSIAAFVSQ
jgi:carboxypeptidase C (cathepsin A)